MGDELFATQIDGVVHEVKDDFSSALAAAGFTDAEEIGKGGFGVVYRCRQVALKRVVAVKVLLTDDNEDRARFVREQHAMAKLTGHPNILPVLEVGETATGHPFLVMPYCAQGCIQQRITRLGALDVDEVWRLGVKIAGALARAHEVQVVHRDVKPANILYSDFGEPALCDFGIAHISGGFKTASGVFTGSPAFTAPEVLAGEATSAASDIYGLGASLYTALTGHAPFERRAGEAVLAHFTRIASERVPDLRVHGISEAAATIVHHTMARDPADRPSASALGDLIREAQTQLGQPVDPMARHSQSGPGLPSIVPFASAGGTRAIEWSTISDFVGREEELAQLQELLLSTSRLVTLTGTGGVGKTAVARQVGAQLRTRYTDRPWLVELGEVREQAMLIDAVAAALGLRDHIGRAMIDVVVDFLGKRQALLILDNCEYLINDVASLAEVLLRDCPDLTILVTSREVLDFPGEVVQRLAPLSGPAVGENPSLPTLSGYEAVELFVQRARAAVPGFELDARNAPAVARCCVRTEGLPLAIELAAARMRAMSVEQIAEALADRFALLSQGRRGAVARRQSLGACMKWSYDLCTPSERRLWCRLSVLDGDFELPAAQGICGDDMTATEFLNLLCALVDKSIVTRIEHDDGTVRFRLLESLRDYGNSCLTETERLELGRRHADWYRQLLADAEGNGAAPNN